MRGSREDGQGATPRPRAFRRLSGRTQPAPRTDAERIADVAAGADMAVEDVLRDVADFRLALETDMIIAAAAVEADSPEVLSEVIDGERLELATFHDRLLVRLADAAADDELATRRAARAKSSVKPRVGRASRAVAVAAAALAVFGASRAITPQTGGDTTIDATEVAAMDAADQHYADFSSAVTSERPGAVREAAKQLHETIQEMIKDHAHDPAVAQRAAQLLQAEISLLRANDPDGASHVLAQARGLIVLLERAAPPKVRASVQPVLDAALSPSPKPKPKPTASPTPTPKPTTATPKPTATPKATSSSAEKEPDDNGPLDTP